MLTFIVIDMVVDLGGVVVVANAVVAAVVSGDVLAVAEGVAAAVAVGRRFQYCNDPVYITFVRISAVVVCGMSKWMCCRMRVDQQIAYVLRVTYTC